MGIPVNEILTWSSLEIGYWQAIASLEHKEAETARQNDNLRQHVNHGISDIKGKMKHGNRR